MMVERKQVLSNSRWAGQVKRWHTWPTIQSQTTGEHTWQMLRMYFLIWGPPSPEVTTYITWHDAGELTVGDTPHGAKASSKVLAQELDRMELEAMLHLAGSVPLLESQELMRVKICDILDQWEFGHSELMLGNKLAEPVVMGAIAALDKLLHTDEGERELKLVNQYMQRQKELFKA